jgi:outer membrane protein OmpA-like peptidoglycan-associated protein
MAALYRPRRHIALMSGAIFLMIASATTGSLAQSEPPAEPPSVPLSVRIFDEAPSFEQLRSIMVPESKPATSRAIVIDHSETVGSAQAGSASTRAIQQAATRPTAPESPVADERANATPTHPITPVHKVANRPGAAGFHINFGFDSATLPESARSMVNIVAQLMKDMPYITVLIEGHTDATGAVWYNKTLSERRALAVAQYLMQVGIDSARLSYVGKGASEPLVPDHFDPVNRRVQFVRLN